jgi:ribulose-phosphate 3-epimerase
MHKVKERDIMIAASVSCMDMMNLKTHMAEAEEAGIDFYHFDVVDGEFNDCFILGQTLLESMRHCTEWPIEVHLAVYRPEKHIERFVKLGADYVGVHYEAMAEPRRIFDMIRKLGAIPVLTYRAETPFQQKDLELLEGLGWVNKLTVNPGYSGQKMQMPAVQHIRDMQRAATDAGLQLRIQADGNINESTIPIVVEAGADILTGGTSGLFKKGRSVKENVHAMRCKAHQAASSTLGQ